MDAINYNAFSMKWDLYIVWHINDNNNWIFQVRAKTPSGHKECILQTLSLRNPNDRKCFLHHSKYQSIFYINDWAPTVLLRSLTHSWINTDSPNQRLTFLKCSKVIWFVSFDRCILIKTITLIGFKCNSIEWCMHIAHIMCWFLQAKHIANWIARRRQQQ